MTILTAEPAWAWDDKLPGERGASAHLHPQTTEQIARVELPLLDADSVLFLWRPASRLQDALYVCKSWGFEPKTEIVWIKTTSTGKRAFGMGRVVRGEHETCLVATRGKPQVLDHSVRSTFSAQQQPFSKPDEFYDIVAQLYQGAPPAHMWYDRTAQQWGGGWRLHQAVAAHKRSGTYVRASERPHARRGAAK